MNDKILTKEHISELRGYADQESGIGPGMAHRVFDTIDHLYAQRDALMRVKEAAEKSIEDGCDCDPHGETCSACWLGGEIAAYAEAEKRGFK